MFFEYLRRIYGIVQIQELKQSYILDILQLFSFHKTDKMMQQQEMF